MIKKWARAAACAMLLGVSALPLSAQTASAGEVYNIECSFNLSVKGTTTTYGPVYVDCS
jgi:hypothetical protein